MPFFLALCFTSSNRRLLDPKERFKETTSTAFCVGDKRDSDSDHREDSPMKRQPTAEMENEPTEFHSLCHSGGDSSGRKPSQNFVLSSTRDGAN